MKVLWIRGGVVEGVFRLDFDGGVVGEVPWSSAHFLAGNAKSFGGNANCFSGNAIFFGGNAKSFGGTAFPRVPTHFNHCMWPGNLKETQTFVLTLVMGCDMSAIKSRELNLYQFRSWYAIRSPWPRWWKTMLNFILFLEFRVNYNI